MVLKYRFFEYILELKNTRWHGLTLFAPFLCELELFTLLFLVLPLSTSTAKDICYKAAETGDCQDYEARWYFDTKEEQCRQFYYGGCGGNENNFRTEDECLHRCEKPAAPEVAPPVESRPPVETEPRVGVEERECRQ